MNDSPATGAETALAEAALAEADTPRLETPRLALAGFDGPLERLLELARAERIDLAGVSLGDLVAQLSAALARAAPLAAKGDWVVMAAWLLLLRSRLLLPADAPGQQAAATAALDLRARLLRLREARGLADWLDRRPRPGRDFFCRGRAPSGTAAADGIFPAPDPLADAFGEPSSEAIDVIEFLWSSMALFDTDPPEADTVPRYRPRPPDLHSIVEARARILRLLAEAPEGRALAALLPSEAAAAPAGAGRESPRRRSAWSSTFVASLELARQGQVTLTQEETPEGAFGAIRVAPRRD